MESNLNDHEFQVMILSMVKHVGPDCTALYLSKELNMPYEEAQRWVRELQDAHGNDSAGNAKP
jgi:hypothetical protein